MTNFLTTIPPLIYGTAWKKERTGELVELAILNGFRGVDTACQPKHYHEPGVGQALEKLSKQGITRESLYLQTKFTPLSGQDPTRIPYDPAAPLEEQVHQSFQMSLKNLNTEYLDALILHSPLPKHAQTMEVWRAMENLHQKGLVHRIGISNCYDPGSFQMIYDEAAVKPSLLQNRFYRETDYDKQLRQFCVRHQIHYQSFWTLTANPNILNHPIMQRVAADKGVTVEQLFFRFLTYQQIIPLIGSCSEKHMQEDLSIFEISLSNEIVSDINALLL